MGAIVPFHRTGSGGGPRARASGRAEGQLLPADPLQQSETLRQTHQHIAEAWRLRAESRRIQRDYEARQRKIEALLEKYRRMRLPSIWDDPANIERLVTMWETAGISAAQIGKILGVSKSAIIGKAHRLGLVDRALPRAARLLKIEQDIEQVSKPPNKRPLPPPTPYQATPPPTEPPIGSFSLLELRAGHCRWPCSDGFPPYKFCGEKQASNSSYCETHMRLSMGGQPRGQSFHMKQGST